MAWDVEFTEEFECWWTDLDEPVQDAIDRAVHLLEARGPTLLRRPRLQAREHAGAESPGGRRPVPDFLRLRPATGGDPAHRRQQGGRRAFLRADDPDRRSYL